MKYLTRLISLWITVISLLTAIVVSAQDADQGQAQQFQQELRQEWQQEWRQEWAGLYVGQVSGAASQLTLNRTGNDIIGILDTQGYRYKVEGNLQQGKLVGFCQDITNGKVGLLSATLLRNASASPENIIIHVVLPGSHRSTRLVFERAETVDSFFSEIAGL